MMQLDLFYHHPADLRLFPWRPTHPLVVSAAVAIHMTTDAEALSIWRRILDDTFDPLRLAGVPEDSVHTHALSFRDAVQAALNRLGPDDGGTPQGVPVQAAVVA